MKEEAPFKIRKPRSDKGVSRKPLAVMPKVAAQESPIVAIVDGEIILCEAWGIDGGFIKFRYWPEQRGRIGTRMIALASVKDFRVEEPQTIQPVFTQPVMTSGTLNLFQNATGPVQELNPLIAMRQGDPKAARGSAVIDPVGMRPMTKITDSKTGQQEIIEAGMQ